MRQNTGFYIGGSGLHQTDDFQKFCGSGLDRIQFLRIRIRLGLKNMSVCSSLLGVTDAWPFFCASLIKAMVHCICTCDTQLWHFVFATILPTGRSRIISKFSSRSQSKTSWPTMK